MENQKSLQINPKLAKELRPLNESEMDALRKSIKRDGVLDAIKYWVNPKGGKAEIVDGHHRHQIAMELGVPYEVQELQFRSITCVLYWMHRNGAGRRDGHADARRMFDLLAIIKAEQQESVKKVELVEEVAEDAKVAPRTVYRELAREPDPPPKVIEPLMLDPDAARLRLYRRAIVNISKLDLVGHCPEGVLIPNWDEILRSIDKYGKE